MVDNHHVRRGGLLPHPRDVAVVVPRTLGAQARLGGRGDVVPERKVLGKVFDFCTVAGLGSSRPFAHDRKEHALADQAAVVQQYVAMLCLLLGSQLRIACIVSALIFHRALGDQMQFIMFMKNFAIAGGFLLLVARGAGGWSLDARREAQAAPGAGRS